jgi:N-acyl-D-aspartate/D-glutamate deacylase
MSYDLVVRNARICDGSGACSRHGSVAVTDGKIVGVDKNLSGGKREINADGLTLAPGFIDIHTHYDAQISWDRLLTPSCWHGVTTVLMGNCGVGVAPCGPSQREVLAWDLVNVEAMSYEVLMNAVSWEWESFPQYIEAIKRHGTALNIAMMVPLAPLRFYVMGEASMERAANATEIERMTQLLREAVDAGACGFSLTISPQHIGYRGRPLVCRLASNEELTALARVLRQAGRGIIQINLPRSQNGLITDHAYDTVTLLARESGRPVTFTPFISMPGCASDLVEKLRARLEPAWREGLRIRTQTGCRPVKAYLNLKEPFIFGSYAAWKPAINRSLQDQMEYYRSAQFRTAFREEMKQGMGVAFRNRWDLLDVARVHKDANQRFLNKNIMEVAGLVDKDPLDAFLDLALDENLDTGFRLAAANFEEDQLIKQIRADYMMIGLSDAGAHVDQLCDAGMPTHLLAEWVRKRGLMTLEEGVRRLTSDPAEFFGFVNKGRVAAGYDADLVLFNPDELELLPQEWVQDLPCGRQRIVERAEGYACTIVGGEVSFEKDRHQGPYAGRVL